jgi:hypothetical protein
VSPEDVKTSRVDPVNTSVKPTSASIVQFAAGEIIEITELEPSNGKFIGKQINPHGYINDYPLVKLWKQRVVQVPATIPALCAYLREARTRNVCLIRGAPANIERRHTRRQRAHEVKHGKDRGDHGFLDAPSRLFWFDIDGAPMRWMADPEGAIRNVVAQLGQPWNETSFCWFFSGTHGLEREGKHWTGKIVDGVVRARLGFITERALTADEASAFTKIAQARVGFKLDAACTRVVQPNYILRPRWDGHLDEDVLGDIPSIGYVNRKKEFAPVPADLLYQARWAKAQGHQVDIADHPDAEAAVRGIGSDGSVRSHLKSAVVHLLDANPAPDVTSFADHSITIVDQLQKMVERHHDQIVTNLEPFGRSWDDVLHYLRDNMIDWAHWLLDHPAALNRKTIKLVKEEKAKAGDQGTRETILARVERAIERARKREAIAPVDSWTEFANEVMPPVVLLVAPTGVGKSTRMRAAALQHVSENPSTTVVILLPRHRLGDEQIELLGKEHPDADYRAAVWRGRHAWNPDIGDGREERMCQRSEEAEELEKLLLNVEDHLCKQGRGKRAVKCPLYDVCAYQGQKQIAANVWFAAHECMVHEMPKAFGKVSWVIIDESPLDAFMWGVDINDQVTLELDALRFPLTPTLEKVEDARLFLADGRDALYRALDKLQVPIDRHKGAPVSNQSLFNFYDETLYGAGPGKWWARGHDAHQLYRLEWRGKVEPDIRPDMTKKQVYEELAKAAGNGAVKKRAILWQLIEQVCGSENKVHERIRQARGDEHRLYGRVQLHRGKEGRIIRMVGLHSIAKGWDVRTLLLDATGDSELLRAIWPQLETDESVHGWVQLPRPKSVQMFQCVDRTLSKLAVAVEGQHPKEIARKIDAARRLYAALLMRALAYGGQDVAAILYKSTETWIRENCCVPEWLKLYHHGDVAGTNALQSVRALFVIGRPLASPEAVTRQTEALFGEYIAEQQREYRVRRKHGRIPIMPDAKGNNTIRVDVREHAHPLAERVRRQITEAAIIQAAGRARAGLRGEGEPLDLHLWTDVPVPELGPVEPVLWEDVAADLDGVMLATGGVLLESAADAAQAYKGLFTVEGLRSARKSSDGVPLIGTSISKTPLLLVRYQKTGQRQRPTKAWALAGIDARAWLEEKLGPLARFEVEGREQASAWGGEGNARAPSRRHRFG